MKPKHKAKSYPTIQTTFNRPTLIYLREDQWCELNKLASNHGRSKLIREAIDFWLARRPGQKAAQKGPSSR